jgi:hypothetical protein
VIEIEGNLAGKLGIVCEDVLQIIFELTQDFAKAMPQFAKKDRALCLHKILQLHKYWHHVLAHHTLDHFCDRGACSFVTALGCPCLLDLILLTGLLGREADAHLLANH